VSRQKRGHNEGSFYQTAAGQWRGALTVHQADGTVKRVYLRGHSKRDIQKKAADVRERLAQGLSPIDDKVTVRDYLHRWLEDVAKHSGKPRTYETYAHHVEKLSQQIGGMKLTALRPAHVQKAYAALLDAGAAPATVHLTHAVLHRALKQAKRWKLVPTNVAEDVDLPRVERVERQTLSAEDVGRALDTAEATGDRLAALWTLLATTGLRVGEALGVRWHDLDLDGRQLTLRVQLQYGRTTRRFELVELKNSRKARPLLLTEDAVTALRAHRVRQAGEQLRAAAIWPDSDLVFRTEAGQPLQQSTVHNVWVRLLKAAALPRVRPHDLRHGVATLLLADGVHPRVVQELLGHSTVSMTLDRYSHVLPALHADAVARLGVLLKRSG
jgi:integrase